MGSRQGNVVGTHDVEWAVIGVAVALLSWSALFGGVAIARRRRTWTTKVLIPAAAILGWITLVAGLLSSISPMTGDTIAGTPVAAAPGLVQAGVPTTPTTTKTAAPDPMSLLKVGDCVEVPMEQATGPDGKPTSKPGSPSPADCNSLDANYRVLQNSPEACTGNLYKLETSRHDKAGKLIYHLCLAFDWRVGFCYDTATMDEPSKVDCTTSGQHIVQVTGVLEDTTDGARCPRDGNGAVWVTWDKRHMTVCFRGSDNPGR
ncbi:hypothetical protein AB0N05_06700 [Nocardia sp. NPDC051030]|uniref:hypothetical protein n=1 Tax=Nocardia sp. NPDC051030 TaxID=3155162 RepID=UPI00344AE8F1